MSDVVKLKTTAHLGYNCFELFEDLMKNIPEKCKEIKINMKRTENIDSSGLGLLLNMKYKMGERGISITLKNIRKIPHIILLTAVFDRHFNLLPL